jgi:hypothetical protein
MKKIIILSIFAAMLLTPFTSNAEIRPSVSVGSLFEVNMSGANKIKDSDATLFNFDIANLKNADKIGSFKMRIWCGEGVSVQTDFSASIDFNECGKLVDMGTSTINKFALTFNNNAQKIAPFSFKLKAYDRNGKWLHSVKKSFQWK